MISLEIQNFIIKNTLGLFLMLAFPHPKLNTKGAFLGSPCEDMMRFLEVKPRQMWGLPGNFSSQAIHSREAAISQTYFNVPTSSTPDRMTSAAIFCSGPSF